jgi:hypothetical protein
MSTSTAGVPGTRSPGSSPIVPAVPSIPGPGSAGAAPGGPDGSSGAGGPPPGLDPLSPLGRMLAGMADALAEEASHAQRAATWIRLRNGRRLRAGLDHILYCFDADGEVWFPAGSTAELAGGLAGSGDEPVAVEVLEVRGASVWLEASEDLGEAVPLARIRSNPWYLLDALRLRLDELRGLAGDPEKAPSTEEDLRLVGCLLGLQPPSPRPGAPAAGEIAASYEALPANDSQLRAVAACLGSELQFVWGPPGTGKTETLGLLAAEAYLRGESVIVLAHSNAAVDAAALALVRNLDRTAAGRERAVTGEALRVGDPFLAEAQGLPVTERAVLQRRRPDLIARLEALEGRGGELMDRQDSLFGGQAAVQRRAGRELGKVTDDLRKVREQIARAEKEVLEDAQLVLATLAKAAITPEIYERRFDRVLVDEASMAQPPQVVLAAALASRGPHGALAVFGDFRQLAPVVGSWAAPVKHWLGRDVFDLNGLVRSPGPSPLLSVLDVQYRMHPKIMGLVNGPAYGGRLIAGPGIAEATATLAASPPAAGHPVAWLDTGEAGARAFATQSHSRVNPLSAWLALAVAQRLRAGGLEGIGIITPYRDQARLLRLLVRGAGVQDAVHTGTVHRFQGGERDAIILDLVDTVPMPPGILFRSDDGLRLANVAVTRARGKLVCLSDGTRARPGPPASPVSAILANLQRDAAPLEVAEVIDASVTDAGWAVLKPSTDTATLLEHDLAQSASVIAYEAGLPAWVAPLLQQRTEGLRRGEKGARALLLDAQLWLFPKREPWSLRLSDPQVVKLLTETMGTPAAPRAAPVPGRLAAGAEPAQPGVPAARVGSGAGQQGPPTTRTGGGADVPAASRAGPASLGTCRGCGQELWLAVSGSGWRIVCPACGAYERDAEPIDLTAAARARALRCGCGEELRGRRGPTGMFLGCSAYPDCRSTRPARVLLAP